MGNKDSFKAGIYFSHYECFGHTARVVAVGEVFKKRFPYGDLFFIQAGLPQPETVINRLGKTYVLPGTLVDRRHFRGVVGSAKADVAKRAKMCTDIVTCCKPDLFITEFFPFGREECRRELILALTKASMQHTVLWAVAGYPLLTGFNHEWRQAILKLYQKIIIFAPFLEKKFIADSFPIARHRAQYLNFFEKNKQKIKFAGYLLPQQAVVMDDGQKEAFCPVASKGVCRVAVVRGGGAYYPKIIAQAIRASDLLGEEYYLTVVAGPATSLEEWNFFTSLVARKKVDNLILLKSIGDYEGLIKKSDVCVSTASYHTSVMLLKHCKKAVVIPFEGYGSMSFHEQPARAFMLKEMMGARILSIKNLTVRIFVAAIRKTACAKAINSQIPEEWFNGADVLDKMLIELFGP